MLRNLKNCENGNFGLLTALILPVLLGAAGLAIDFSQALLVKTELQGAADAALLGNVGQSSKIMKAALTTPEDGDLNVPKDEVEAHFNVHAIPNRIASEIEILNITARKKDGLLTATMTFRAELPTTFSRILGQDSIGVTGRAAVTTILPLYRDYYVLLDNSPSMGVAATPRDIDAMRAQTGGCQFACHTTTGGENFYEIARRNNIRLRIDLLQSASLEMIKHAEKSRLYSSQYRFSMYNFGEDITKQKLNMFSPMTYPSKSLSDNLKTLELMTLAAPQVNDHAATDIYGRIEDLLKVMGRQGNGHTPSGSVKTMIIVTDGVEGTKRQRCSKRKVPRSGLCQEPLVVDACEDAKKLGFKVAVLYTTYLPLQNDKWWREWISPFTNEIADNLKKCASDGMFVEASFDHDLGEAMTNLFKATMGNTVLTQ